MHYSFSSNLTNFIEKGSVLKAINNRISILEKNISSAYEQIFEMFVNYYTFHSTTKTYTICCAVLVYVSFVVLQKYSNLTIRRCVWEEFLSIFSCHINFMQRFIQESFLRNIFSFKLKLISEKYRRKKHFCKTLPICVFTKESLALFKMLFF